MEFNFNNHEHNLLKDQAEDLYVQIKRVARRTPFQGMKQPAPHGSIMGMETVVEVVYKGKPASFMQWELLRDNQPHQMGLLDKDGKAGELRIPLDDDATFTIRFFPNLTENSSPATEE